MFASSPDANTSPRQAVCWISRFFMNTSISVLGKNCLAVLALSAWLMGCSQIVGLADAQTVKVGQLSSETEKAAPPPLKTYMGRTIAEYMTFHGAPWLVRDTREEEETPKVTMEQLGLKAGMVVCDLGCGNGFYSLPIAKAIAPNGKVLAVDIQSEMLELLSGRAIESNVKNIEPILGSVIDPKLPEAGIDLVLMVDVYHEFSHPVHMLAAIRKSLKPNGMIALVEFRGEDPQVPIKPLHKMTKKQILSEYEANGFKLAREFDRLPIQHLMFFARDENWKAQ